MRVSRTRPWNDRQGGAISQFLVHHEMSLSCSVLWCCRRRSEDSTRSVDSMMVRLVVRPDGISTLSSEGSGETAPVQVMGRQGQGEPSMRLSGGSGGTRRKASAHLNGSQDSHSANDEGRHGSSNSSSTDCGTDLKEGSPVRDPCSQSTQKSPVEHVSNSLDKDAQQRDGSPAEANEHDVGSSGQDAGSAGQDPGSGQEESGQELQREVSSGNASMTSSVTNTDMALYEDLDALQDEPSALGDLSSEEEEDASVAAERLKLGHFPVEVGPPTCPVKPANRFRPPVSMSGVVRTILLKREACLKGWHARLAPQ